MMQRITNPVCIGYGYSLEAGIDCLTETLPEDAHGVFVVIYTKTPGLVGSDFAVMYRGRLIPVSFWNADDRNPEGNMVLAYGVGNLESSLAPIKIQLM